MKYLPQLDGNTSVADLSAWPLPASNTSADFHVAVVNARSLTSKLEDVTNLIKCYSVGVALISETWESSELSKQVEKITQLNSISWYSRPRPGRGGGVAIVVDNYFATSKPLDIATPPDIEIVWSLVSPLAYPSVQIVAGAFYSPPQSSNYAIEKGQLEDHILDVMALCKNKYNNVYFVIGGDINDDCLDAITEIDGFNQVVQTPTRGDKILDVIISNASLDTCRTAPPLSSDDESLPPSDHKVAVAKLLLPTPKKVWTTLKKRRVTERAIENYRVGLASTDWRCLSGLKSVDEQVDLLDDKLSRLSNEHFPIVKSRAKLQEPLWFHPGIRSLWCKMKKLYKSQGNSIGFKKAKKKFRKALHESKESFYNKYISQLKNSHPRRWHQLISQLSRNGGQREDNHTPDIPGFDVLTNKEKAEKVADQIESLTKSYKVIDRPKHLKTYEGGANLCVQYREVVETIKSSKIPHGLHEMDPPREVIKRFAELFAVPLTIIYNNCLRSSTWPSKWKVEQTNMIPKKKILESLKDLRPIAITPIFSKILEAIIKKPLLADIQHRMHSEQYGGIKGVGPNHYLSGLVHDISEAAEDGMMSLLLTFDFSSAFNSLNHDVVIQSGAKLGIRRPLLRLLSSYLSERYTVVRWGSSHSSPRLSRGGSGQGTLLSVNLFLVAVNELLEKLDERIAALEGTSTHKSKPRLYVDDLAILVHFKSGCFPKDGEGNKIFQDDGRIEEYLRVVEEYSAQTGMKLNKQKTAAVSFDFSKSKVVFHGNSIVLDQNNHITLQHEVKLLGFMIDENLTLHSFVRQRRRAGMAALWGLKRLRANGMNNEHLKTSYEAYVRSSTEYAITAVFPSLKIRPEVGT